MWSISRNNIGLDKYTLIFWKFIYDWLQVFLSEFSVTWLTFLVDVTYMARIWNKRESPSFPVFSFIGISMLRNSRKYRVGINNLSRSFTTNLVLRFPAYIFFVLIHWVWFCCPFRCSIFSLDDMNCRWFKGSSQVEVSLLIQELCLLNRLFLHFYLLLLGELFWIIQLNES